MAKTNRGRNLKKNPGWRGTCPICKRKRVKLLWPGSGEQKDLRVCKKCGNK